MQNFKQKVYAAAKRIPRGKVSTYGALAKAAGSPKAARAVGTLMHRNDYSHSGVPCHRVVKSSGEAGEYAAGTSRKISLLKQEGIVVKGGKIDLSEYAYKF